MASGTAGVHTLTHTSLLAEAVSGTSQRTRNGQIDRYAVLMLMLFSYRVTQGKMQLR